MYNAKGREKIERRENHNEKNSCWTIAYKKTQL